MKKYMVAFVLVLTLLIYCQTFTDINAGLTGVSTGAADWGDYDNDGDLDILLTGYTAAGRISKIYRNDSGVFTDINAGLEGVSSCSAEWGDYDNDGDLDIMITGEIVGVGLGVFNIYRNDSGVFTDINVDLIGVEDNSVIWGDYDNDGDLDILSTGYDGQSVYLSDIYRNDSGVFTNIYAGLQKVYDSSVDWGDYDNDGDLDILLTGKIYNSGSFSAIYRNDSGHFTYINAGLPGVYLSSAAWGDYDNDGDVDILLTGSNSAKIFRNNSGVFTDINAGLPGISYSSVAWGDCDNDGDLDILLTGSNSAKIFRNDSGIFTDINAGLVGIQFGSAAWGDYDNDGDLDVLLSGSGITSIYRNDLTTPNNAPMSPENLSSSINGYEITFSWNKSTDNETPQDGLSYNLYIGSDSQVPNTLSPMSNLINGYRKIVNIGNACQNTSWTLSDLNLPSGTYYWSVQALDHTYSGSDFSTEQVVVYNTPLTLPPVAIDPFIFSFYDFIAIWSSSEFAIGYYLDVATDSLFNDFVSGYENFDVGNVLSYQVAGLDYDTEYFYRVRSYNCDNVSSDNSNTASVKTRFAEFSEISTNLEGISSSSAAWGDYDNDGDLDILMTGNSSSGSISKIYRNDSGVFSHINAGLYSTAYGTVSWGDYDNDGDLDILLTGLNISKILRNDSGVFSDIYARLPRTSSGRAAWGDYDNDGDLDLLLAGQLQDGTNDDYSGIYRNDSGVFTDINAGLIGVRGGSTSWADYDNDGDLDILLSGYNWDGTNNYISAIYRNDSGSFVDINAGLFGGYNSSVDWGDYDCDGDLDILLSAYNNTSHVSKIYRNDNGVFTDVNAGLTGVSSGSVSWGDFDNDGDLDILLSGGNQTGRFSQIYRNDSGLFTDIYAGLVGVSSGSADWGDYDNDGDLDILLTGRAGGSNYYNTIIYRNNCLSSNTLPSSPINLSATLNGSEATFTWDRSSDIETPRDGLSYNLYIGTSSLNEEANPSMSNTSNGYRKVVQLGNVNQNTSWKIDRLSYFVTYYWSVQAIDNSYAGSEFAPEQSFSFSTEPIGNGSVLDPYLIADLENLCWIAQGSLRWNYNYIQTADIDAGATMSWIADNGSGWSPIGTEINHFTGSYDGQGYSINNLNLERPLFYHNGLFGYTSNAEISNINLTNTKIAGSQYTSCLIGRCDSTSITKCNVSGELNGTYQVGGITGYSSSSYINECSSNLVTSGVNTIGGLVGASISNSTITRSFSTGSTVGATYVGGLLGYSNQSAINNCYSTNSVEGDNYIGGLVGYNVNTTLNNSYSTGNVIGEMNTGGFIGFNNLSTVSNCFWDIDTSGLPTSAAGIGKTTAEMKTDTTYTIVGWDFVGESVNGTEDIWQFDGMNNNGYPYLSWQIFIFEAPQDINIVYNTSDITLEWTAVPTATSYTVFSSPDPYASFPASWTLEVSELTGTIWTDTSAISTRKFYVVTSVNSSK